MAVREMPRQSKQSDNRSMAAETRQVSQDLMQYAREYARENPEATALWCLGIGFVLGWKLKPW